MLERGAMHVDQLVIGSNSKDGTAQWRVAPAARACACSRVACMHVQPVAGMTGGAGGDCAGAFAVAVRSLWSVSARAWFCSLRGAGRRGTMPKHGAGAGAGAGGRYGNVPTWNASSAEYEAKLLLQYGQGGSLRVGQQYPLARYGGSPSAAFLQAVSDARLWHEKYARRPSRRPPPAAPAFSNLRYFCLVPWRAARKD